ncbi:MAG TPA: hypothetical protein DGK99_06470 [Acidimicrobiaceae bacterium]|nr:hypothetical protein [Acidimicrobiaceae bacterium]
MSDTETDEPSSEDLGDPSEDGVELDVDDLDGLNDEVDGDDPGDDDSAGADESDESDDEDEDEEGARPVGDAASDEEEEDDDEVEDDLDAILRDRIAAAADDDDEEDEDEASVKAPAPNVSPGDLVERQDDELHCPHCFLLVQASAVASSGECGHCGGPIS